MEKLCDVEDLLPPKPTSPLPSDCCGTGCSPCVHDLYLQDLKIWKKKREQICAKKENDEDLSVEVLSCCNYTKFELIRITKLTKDTSKYTFKIPNNKDLGIGIGRHVVIKSLLKNQIIVRQYTPISNTDCKGFFDLMIKIYPNGNMSSFVSQWKVGDDIEMRGPFGTFTYKENSFQNVLMLAAGTGIAPMFQIIKCILDNENDFTKIHLMYASKNLEDVLLRDELLPFLSFWNFTACYFLSNEENIVDKRYLEQVQLRKMTKNDVEREIKSISTDGLLVLICGTKSFEKDMVNASLNAEVKENRIFKF